MKCRCHEIAEEKIGNVFERFGKFVARHPWKIIICVVVVNGALGAGMTQLAVDIDISRVYTPMNSQAVTDEKIVQDIYPDKSGSDFYGYQLTSIAKDAVIILKPNSGTVLDVTFLAEVKTLVDIIRTVVGNLNGNDVRYADICAVNTGSCAMDGEVFWSPEFNISVISNNVTYPNFLLNSGISVGLDSLLAGVQTNSSGVLTSATHLKLKFNLRSDTTDFVQKSEAWQTKFVEVLQKYASSQFDFAFAHSGSLSEELNANIAGDIALFSVTFTLMITYACLATYSAKHDCIGNRMFLGFAGVLAAGLAIIASFGLVSACGMSFVSIVGNVPFLIIGIGVDDMFILLSGLANAPYDGNTNSRIGQMMRTSGVAITITSLTSILAFAIGATSTFKSVRNFCVFTGVAVAFCYINQVAFFSSCLAVNEERINSKRHFAICCKKTKSKDKYRAEHASLRRIICCAGERPTSRKDVESILERVPRQILSKLVSYTPVKFIILFVFMIYLGFSIYGAIHLQQGLVINNLVADDSYFYKYLSWNDEHFKNNDPVSFVIRDSLDYSSLNTQNQVTALLQKASQNTLMSNSRISWLEAFINSPFYNQTNFVPTLNSFLNHVGFARFKNDVVIQNGDIVSSRLYAFSDSIADSQDQAQMMLDMREMADESPLNVVAFSPPFIFYEQYVAILPQTLQTLGLSIVAVFVVTCCFMPHPLLLLYVVITMSMIITGVVGFMYYWGLTLSSITMIHLIMSVGFSVDFTAHICHAFMVAEGKNRDERVKVALETSGGPIINGGVSSVLGILMLISANSYIFQSFFKVMLTVILFGLGHAVLFLPVVLSFIGPAKSSSTHIDETSKNKSNRNGYASPYYNSPRNTPYHGRVNNGRVPALVNGYNGHIPPLVNEYNGHLPPLVNGYNGQVPAFVNKNDRVVLSSNKKKRWLSPKNKIDIALSGSEPVAVFYDGRNVSVMKTD